MHSLKRKSSSPSILLSSTGLPRTPPRNSRSTNKSTSESPLRQSRSLVSSPSHRGSGAADKHRASFSNLKEVISRSERENENEGHIQEVLESRLSSMMKLRMQMEQLTDMQKREESNYMDMMKEFIKKNYVDRDKRTSSELTLKQRVEELEKKLKEEVEERVQTQKMFSTFRAEGSSIIHRLRDSLTRISQKYRETSERLNSTEHELIEQKQKNEQLGQLYDEAVETLKRSANSSVASSDPSEAENYQDQIAYMKRSLGRAKREIRKLRGNEKVQTDGETEEDTHWDSMEVNRLKSKLKTEKELRLKTERGVEEKFMQFQLLVEEEEEVIEALKKRIQAVELENDKLKQQVQTLLSSKEREASCITDGNDIPQEFVDIYTELKSLLDPEDNHNLQAPLDQKISPYDKIKAQDRLIKLLLAKLKAEEKERLTTEEQTAKMVAEEEKTIFFLEKKIKDLEDIVTQQKEEAAKERSKLNQLVASDKLKYFELVVDEERIKALDEELQRITQDLNDEIAANPQIDDSMDRSCEFGVVKKNDSSLSGYANNSESTNDFDDSKYESVDAGGMTVLETTSPIEESNRNSFAENTENCELASSSQFLS